MNYFINVTDAPYNAKGDGITNDAPALQNAIDDATNSGQKCVILIPAGTYLIGSGLTIQNASSIQIMGEGAWNGTTLKYAGETGDIITFSGCYQCNMSLLDIQCATIPAGGNAIVISGNSYVIEIHDVRMDYCYNGIWIKEATESRLSKIQFRYMYGDYGIKHGGGESGCYRAVLDDIIANNPYLPHTSPSSGTDWAQNKAYAINDVVLANGCIYQCTGAGTSAQSGTGPSGYGGGFNNTTPITDGKAGWVFISKMITWILQESFGYSLVVNKAGLICGGIGYVMQNTASPANPPMWIIVSDMECDHSYYANALFGGGNGVYINNSWFSSCLTGNGLTIVPSFAGQFTVSNSRISCAAMHGILIGAYGNANMPGDILIQNNFIGANSQSVAYQYHGIVAVATGISITGNRIGTDIGVGGNVTQGYGVCILSQSDNVIVTSNNLTGNYLEGTNITDGGAMIVKDNLPRK